jgi:N-acetyl sugar amidotransferase
VKYCKRCVLPDSRPGIQINEDGICSGCIGHDFKEMNINWAKRRRELEEIVAEVKISKSSYDCIVPVSGGKDSWYQIIMAQQLGLTPLAVTWRTPGMTAIGQRNIDNMITKLGIDHVTYTIDPDTERRFMIAAFEEKGDPGLPMHMAIFVIPNRLAVQMRIPLVIWGENPQLEFGGTEAERRAKAMTPDWFSKHGCMQGTTWVDYVGKQGLTEQRLLAYQMPEKAEFVPRAIFLGAFIKWNSFENARIARDAGFEWAPKGARTGTWDFADIDCDFISLHHYPKWHKFGMSRAFDNLSIQIRHGEITRDEAIATLREVGMQTPHHDITKFCKFAGKPESWFWDTCEKFRNRNLWTKDGKTWKIPNFLIENFNWES